MKKFLITISFMAGVLTFSQARIENLYYAKKLIKVPQKCSAKSEYEILDCNGFSAQWLYLSEEMIKQNVDKQVLSQIENQLEFKSKKGITFSSQNEVFNGYIYKLKNKTYRVIGLGKVNGMPLILNLGFDEEPTSNNKLSEFEKNFFLFK